MTMRRKIQIISPPNDQLTGMYLPNNLAEQWRSILRLVYPVGISRDFNLVPIPGNPNNDTPWRWGECVKYNSYLLFPHRKGITSKEFCWEFREFCKSFNNTFVYDSTGVTRTMFPWTAIGTAVETKTNNISNMAFSVTRAGRITTIDFAEFGYVDVDAIKQTEHFLSLLWSDCRIIATDISPLVPVKDANPMIITLANKDNWGGVIAELKDFIRLQTGHQTFSTATSEIFKDEAFSEEGGAWKIDIGHAIEKTEDEKKGKDMTEVKIYNSHGVLDGTNISEEFTMPDDVTDQWLTVMKSAYPAIVPSAVRLLKLVGNSNCESKYDESILGDSYVLIPQSDVGGLYYTKILDAINARLLHKSNANENIDLPWAHVASTNTILVGVSRRYRVNGFDLHDIRSDDESKNEIRRFFSLISDDNCEMTVVNIGSLIGDIYDARRPLIITLSTKDNNTEVHNELENFMRAKTGRYVYASSMGEIFGFANGSWRLDIGGIIECDETEEEDAVKIQSDSRTLLGNNIPDDVRSQWQTVIKQAMPNRESEDAFYLIPLDAKENYAGPDYADDMIWNSWLLSPRAKDIPDLYTAVHNASCVGDSDVETVERPWNMDRDKALFVSTTDESFIEWVRPAISSRGLDAIGEKTIEHLNLSMTTSNCRIVACDISNIVTFPNGDRAMIVTITNSDCINEVTTNLIDFVSTVTLSPWDETVKAKNGAMIVTFGNVTAHHTIVHNKTDKSGPRELTSKSIKVYTVSVKLTAMNTPPVSVKLDVIAEDDTEALEVAKQQLKLYFKNESVPIYPKVIAESVYDLVSERPILDK